MADPKASDPVEDTSSQVNLAILSSLERLNESMAQLTDYMYQGREAEEMKMANHSERVRVLQS